MSDDSGAHGRDGYRDEVHERAQHVPTGDNENDPDQLFLQILPKSKTFPELPTFDPQCLTVLAYSKFGNAYLKVSTSNFDRWHFIRKTDGVPKLCSGRQELVAVEKIIDCFRELNFGTDYELSLKERADAVAFIALIESHLRPAVLHTYWLENENYEGLTREAYSFAMSLPSALFYPRNLKRHAFHTVYTAMAGNMTYLNYEQVDSKVYYNAVECLRCLSAKLGSHPFLFGNTPTTVDAYMFGYLAPILKLPFIRNRLKGHLESFNNICNTINHILRRYFPATDQDRKEAEDKQKQTKLEEEEEKEFPHKKRDILVAAVFAVTVLVSYALLRGVITIQIQDDEDSQIGSSQHVSR